MLEIDDNYYLAYAQLCTIEESAEMLLKRSHTQSGSALWRREVEPQ